MQMLLPAVLCLVLVSACSEDSPDSGAVVKPHAGHDGLPKKRDNGRTTERPKGYFSFEPIFAPLKFTVDTGGNITVGFDRHLMTELGEIEFGGDVAVYSRDRRKVPDQAFDTTQLIVCQTGTDRKDCHGYQIHTGRKLSIDLNGQFHETVEANRITIDADPGSTVVVTDVGGPPLTGARPAASVDIEEFDLSELSPNTEIDLEKSLAGFAADFSYDHVTGEFRPINGSRVARIMKYKGETHYFRGTGMPDMDLPSEYDCAQTAGQKGQTSFTAADLTADIIVACVGTAEDDFGYVVIGRDRAKRPVSYYVYSYVWVR
jgi:hypothetical protein